MKPILNVTVDSIDKPDSDRGIACRTSTNQLLKLYMEEGKSGVSFVRRRSALHVWVEVIGAIMSLETVGNKQTYLPVTSELHLKTGHDCSDQAGYNYLKVREGQSPSFSVLGPRSEVIFLFVYSASHTYTYFPPRRIDYSGLFCFHPTWLLVPCTMRLSRPLQSTLLLSHYPYELRPKRRANVPVHGELCCSQKVCNRFRGEVAE